MQLRSAMTATLLALVPLGLTTPAAQAQAAISAEAATDNHVRFYETIVAGVDEELVLDNLLRDLTTQLLNSDPNYILMEREAPGLGAELIAELRPVIRAYRERTAQKYRPQMIGVVREVFNDSEAGQLADFYGSPLGRRMMQVVSGNVAIDDRANAIGDGTGTVSQEDIARDQAATVARATAALSDAEMREINAALMRIPAAYRLTDFSTRTLPIRQAMENEPPSAEELEQINAIVMMVIDRYAPKP